MSSKKLEVMGTPITVISGQPNNTAFNSVEFDGIRKQADLNSFNQTAIGQMTLLLADRGVQRLQGNKKP